MRITLVNPSFFREWSGAPLAEVTIAGKLSPDARVNSITNVKSDAEL
jgi:hypothetical protein